MLLGSLYAPTTISQINNKLVNKNETRNRKHHRATAKLAACANSLPGPNMPCDTYRLNFIWIGAPSPMQGKNRQNITILTKCSQFGEGLLCPLPFTDPSHTVKRGNIDRFWDILSFAAVPVRDMNYVDICL